MEGLRQDFYLLEQIMLWCREGLTRRVGCMHVWSGAHMEDGVRVHTR